MARCFQLDFLPMPNIKMLYLEWDASMQGQPFGIAADASEWDILFHFPLSFPHSRQCPALPWTFFFKIRYITPCGGLVNRWTSEHNSLNSLINMSFWDADVHIVWQPKYLHAWLAWLYPLIKESLYQTHPASREVGISDCVAAANHCTFGNFYTGLWVVSKL